MQLALVAALPDVAPPGPSAVTVAAKSSVEKMGTMAVAVVPDTVIVAVWSKPVFGPTMRTVARVVAVTVALTASEQSPVSVTVTPLTVGAGGGGVVVVVGAAVVGGGWLVVGAAVVGAAVVGAAVDGVTVVGVVVSGTVVVDDDVVLVVELVVDVLVVELVVVDVEVDVVVDVEVEIGEDVVGAAAFSPPTNTVWTAD